MTTLASPALLVPRPSILRGIFLMCLGVGMFPFLNTAVKLLTADYPIGEVVWARFVGHLLWVTLLFLPRHGLALFKARRPLVHIGRSCLLLGATAFFISAIGRLPLATATAIGFTSPFIVTALSVPILGEPVGRRRWTAVAIGFLGALIVIRPQPSLDFGAALLALGCAACYGVYVVMTRKVGTEDSAETAIVFAAFVGTVVTSLGTPLFGMRMPQQLFDWGLFVAIGLVGGLGHYFVGRALQQAPAAVVAPFGYLELVGTTALGYLVFGNFPDLGTWVGVVTIVACGLYVGYRERVRREQAKERP